MTLETENPAPGKPEEAFRLQRSAARALAIQYLYQLDTLKCWDCSEEELTLFSDHMRNQGSELSEKLLQKAWKFARQLICGLCEQHTEIDRMLADAADNWALSRMSAVDRSILRLGIYEMIFSGKVTPATAINEAVELAKKFGQADSPRFINGVLDKVKKNRLGTGS